MWEPTQWEQCVWFLMFLAVSDLFLAMLLCTQIWQLNQDKTSRLKLWWRICTEITAADVLPADSWTSLELKSQPQSRQGPASNNGLWVDWGGSGGLCARLKRTPRQLCEAEDTCGEQDDDKRMSKATTYSTVYTTAVCWFKEQDRYRMCACMHMCVCSRIVVVSH